MMIDIPQERGMSNAYEDYSNKEICRFPLIHTIPILGPDGMVICYSILFLCALAIALGFLFRISCICFVCIYWYIYSLDKSLWNNHSTLYGILAFLLTFSDAHRYLSLDGMLRKNIQNTDVPRWNYLVVRFQIFLVYFYAGLKKTDWDWLSGYSMKYLAQHWVFHPLRYICSEEFIDFYIVHMGGFILDISAGILLYFNSTRYIGFLFCGLFHLMNSQLFSIGMFPYMMLGTLPMFCNPDSFKNLIKTIPFINKAIDTTKSETNEDCIEEKSDKTHQRKLNDKSTSFT